MWYRAGWQYAVLDVSVVLFRCFADITHAVRFLEILVVFSPFVFISYYSINVYAMTSVYFVCSLLVCIVHSCM